MSPRGICSTQKATTRPVGSRRDTNSTCCRSIKKFGAIEMAVGSWLMSTGCATAVSSPVYPM